MDFLIRGSDYLARYDDFKLIGRDVELQRLISILMRKHANSVILMGPGGVGCTSLCVGVQAAKNAPDAPFDLLRKRLFWFDDDGLFALGEGEKINHVFHRILRRLEQAHGSILVVEDTRDLIEACRNSGSMHFLNALLVAVRNGSTQVIFETKDEDLEAVLKCHSDLRELFTILPIEEPSGDALKAIVGAASSTLTVHHSIPILYDAQEAAIELTTRYHTRDNGLSRAQPERTITLLDRALASYRLEVHRQPPGYTVEQWQICQGEMRRLAAEQREGENAIAEYEGQLDALAHADTVRATPTVFSGLQSPEMAALHGKIAIVNSALAVTRTTLAHITAEINVGLYLDRTAVLREFASISGISLSRLNQDELAKLKGLDAALLKRIFGQDEVIGRVANGIRVARIGRRNKDRPLAYLFLGPSGVGKTEVSKVLAAALLDDETALTRFDMSEYAEKHAVAKLIGAPPGYEGFEAGGILTNMMRRNSNRVLLFDEIEKAHPDIFNIFLQILEDGRLTDNVGRTVTFDGATIIMTTNIGQPHFLDEDVSSEEAETAALADLGATYRSEFLNRFAGRQNILCFKRLNLDSIEKIVEREIASLNIVYGERGIKVLAIEGVIRDFCHDQYDPKIGARGLPGYISANLEPVLVNAILADQDTRGTALVGYDPAARRFVVSITQEAK